MEEVEAWRNRPLQSFYPFAFVDCIYVSLRTEYGVQQVVVYVMLAYDVNGCKDVPWPLDQRDGEQAPGCRSLTSCGLAALRILASCPWMAWERIGGRRQGCIPACHGSALHRTPHPQFHPLHPTQAVGAFTKQLKLIYGAINVKQARQEFRSSRRLAGLSRRGQRMGKTISHTSSSSITMAVPCARSCTTNAIESVNS